MSARFVFERSAPDGWDIYDTAPSGTGRMNAIGWCDDAHRAVFEQRLNPVVRIVVPRPFVIDDAT